MGRYLKVGVVLERNATTYSRSIRRHLERLAEGRRVDLGFIGVDWADARVADLPEALETTLAAAAEYEAMILLSGVFSESVNCLARFCQRWVPKPIVSVGYRLPGVPSVLVDNREGMHLATTHLVVEHGRRNLVFIRGRRESHEAEERYLGFRHALHDHGILHDGRRILQGDLTREGALRVMKNFVGGSFPIDGILTANDDMGLAVIEELRHRGLRVPADVAVVGFDDSDEARRGPVPLTTLAQPFEHLARYALDCVSAQAIREEVSTFTTLPVQLRARASCGCFPESSLQSLWPQAPKTD